MWREGGGELWMGGTPFREDLWSGDWKRSRRALEAAPLSEFVTLDRFDVRVDLYGWNHRAAGGVAEYVLQLGDSNITRWEARYLLDLADAVRVAVRRVEAGQRVLVNCQAGLNRSGLVTALVLLYFGVDTEVVVDMIRGARSDLCLVNDSFVDFIESQGVRFADRAVRQVL
jgi:hypothetical protein